MKSLLSTPLSSAKLWEFSFVLLGAYLLFHPVLAFPASMAAALGGGLVLLFFQTIPPGSGQILGKPWLLFLVYLLASSFFSISPGMTLQSTGLVFLGTLLYAMAHPNSPEAKGRIEGLGLALAFLASLMALDQWFFGFGRLAPLLPGLTADEHEILQAAIHNKRAFGPLVTHGALAAFLILFIPLGFILANNASGFKRMIFGFSTLIMVLGLLATQSVGAFACLTLAVLAVLLSRSSKTAAGGVLLVGVLGVALLISARGIQSWLMAALGTRLALWKAALSLFAAHPWLGTGLGTFDETYQLAGLSMVTGARFTHNILIQILVETGLTGLVLFLGVLVDLARRFKTPVRWEGWGVMTGVLAFLLFSLLDIPFQMPEIIWFFAGIAGRLELRPAKPFDLPELPVKYLEMGLLIVLFVSGFWPPFRPWNFALLACALWFLAGWFQRKFDQTPLWIFGGALYLAARAFVSPSAMGAVWFFEISGVLLVFYLVLPCFTDPPKFMKFFACLGLAWALKIWWESFHYAAPGFGGWIHFQYSDVKDWIIFPDPKQIGLILIPLVFILWKRPRTGAARGALLFSLLTMLRLKSFGALLGLGAGFFTSVKSRNRIWIGAAASGLGLGLVFLRSLDPSPTKWGRFSDIWVSALKVWEKNPLLGVGPGSFAGLYHQVKQPRLSGVSRYLMDAQYTHNEFLELLTAFGWVGFVFGTMLLIKAWGRVQDPTTRSALAGLGAASLVDFCLHTPLIALQAVGLLVGEKSLKVKSSMVGGFLVFGLAGGLFGPPVFSNLLKNNAENHLSAGQFLPGDLRDLETAERLNPWDARFCAAKADYLEKLFVATKDPVWSRKSDEAFDRVLDLEKVDGQWYLKKAERLSARFEAVPTQEALRAASKAWEDAEYLLPTNAFLDFERGLFALKTADKNEAEHAFEKARTEEPNFAAAWLNEGRLEKEKGEKIEAGICFQKSLEVYNQWKDAERIDPLEKQLVYLPPEAVEFLKNESSLAK